MIRISTLVLALLVLPVLAISPGVTQEAVAAESTAFDAILEHYEPIRLALLADSTDGVQEHGAALAEAIDALRADFSSDRAGLKADADTEVVRTALDEMSTAAGNLAQAGDLAAARDAFYAISKPLVRYRAEVDPSVLGERAAVAYCPMAKKSWLQPAGEIGNPYHGSEMPKCGRIVS